MKPPFDPNDPEAFRRLMVDARVAADDIDAVVRDMLAKKRRRSLGRAQHKKLYRDALRKLLHILEHFLPPPPSAAALSSLIGTTSPSPLPAAGRGRGWGFRGHDVLPAGEAPALPAGRMRRFVPWSSWLSARAGSHRLPSPLMALPNKAKIPVGTVLAGKYRITREIGRGGMAAVYEAENVDIGKRVAIKVLAQELTTSAIVVERFLREARAAAAIRSPYICDVYDSGKLDDGRPFLVLELLEGESLYERMTKIR